MDLETYEAAKAVLEAELAESLDEREKERITLALEQLTKRHTES